MFSIKNILLYSNKYVKYTHIKQSLVIKTYSKCHIPIKMRMKVWNKYCKNKYECKCLCCNYNIMSIYNFSCAHIIPESKGGQITIENLKPVCHLCNTSMGMNKYNNYYNMLNNKISLKQYYRLNNKKFKKKYPQIVKMKIWNKYFDINYYGNCCLCKSTITPLIFKISTLTDYKINSLFPCCNKCNT